MALESIADRINIKDLLVEQPPPGSRRVYVSTLYVSLDVIWPNFEELKSEGITFTSDYPFIGGKRGFPESINRCDLFLAIYGFDKNGPGETQANEFDLARTLGKPMLAFLHSGYVNAAPPGIVKDLLGSPPDQTRVITFDGLEDLTAPVLREIRQFFKLGPETNRPTLPPSESANSDFYIRDLVERGKVIASEVPKGANYSSRWIANFNYVRSLAKLLAEKGQNEIAAGVYDELLDRFALEKDLQDQLQSERVWALSRPKASATTSQESARIRTTVDEERQRLNERLESARKLADEAAAAKALLELGGLARRQGKNEEALRFFGESLEIDRKFKNDAAAAIVLQNMGAAAREQKDFEQARTFFNEALQLSSNLGNEAAEERLDYQLKELARIEKAEKEGGEAFLIRLAPVFERASRLRIELLDANVDWRHLLVSLFDDSDDRTAHAFLASFGITRKQLTDLARRALGQDGGWVRYSVGSDPNRLVEKAEAQNVPYQQGDTFTEGAIRALETARGIARTMQAREALPRHLFQAMLEIDESRVLLDKLMSADAVGWIAEKLRAWDDNTPIKQSAVLEMMVEDDLFVNPPTQRDSAAEKDLLGFEDYADALVQIIRRPETRPPLVIGVYGPWGSGKSTFMGLVKNKLDQLGQTAAIKRGRFAAFADRFSGWFRRSKRELRVTTVNYDAWAYADAQKLWGGLVDKIAKELDAELTARDRVAYLINSQWRRVMAAVILGLIPIAFFVLGQFGHNLPKWLGALLSPDQQKPWLNLPGWITAAGWAVYAYLLQKRPLTDAVASLAARFDSAPMAGLVSRIQDEFKTALQTKIDPEKKPKTMDALRTDIRQRVQQNELKIVVFIDELDRCPLEKIVEILEAIKLFLAEDIFIVLLGVDTRVAAEAIRLHYKDVHNPNLPREYLEKIVQLPLHVPTAARTHIEVYLKSFMTLPDDAITGPSGETAQPSGTEQFRRESQRGEVQPGAIVEVKPSTTEAASRINHVEATGVRLTSNQKSSHQSTPDKASSSAPAPALYDVTALSRSATLPQLPDTSTELITMTAIATEFLDSNPRRVKRLLNTYRYIKILTARLPGSRVQTATWQRTMLYWLAFTMKWPAFMSEAVEAAKQLNAKAPDDSFLINRLKSADKRSQPEALNIKEHLPLTATQALEMYELAPNFLIENPGMDFSNLSSTNERAATARKRTKALEQTSSL